MHAHLTAHLPADVKLTCKHTLCVNVRVVHTTKARASVNASIALPEKCIYCLIMGWFSIIHKMRAILDLPLMNRAGQSGEMLSVIHWCGWPSCLSRLLFSAHFLKFVTVVMDHNVWIAVAYAHIINGVAHEWEQLFHQVEAPRGAIVKKRGVICINVSGLCELKVLVMLSWAVLIWTMIKIRIKGEARGIYYCEGQSSKFLLGKTYLITILLF